MMKLNDNEFKALVNQYDMIDEQIKLMQNGKKRLVESFGITIQAFYSRRKTNGL